MSLLSHILGTEMCQECQQHHSVMCIDNHSSLRLVNTVL